MKPANRDSLHRFLFEQLPVRGEIAHLDASWRAALEQVDYPAVVRDLLGEAMAAVVLLASTIKFEGGLTLQLQGGNPVTLLVVQCTDGLNLRGIAHWNDPLPDEGASLRELVGDEARLAVTIEQKQRNERYQGIVPLEGETLAECFEQYFLRSEQLPTRLFLAANERCAAGMLLQVMPGNDDTRDAWQHVTTLGETVKTDELLELDARTIIHRLYNEDDVRLFEASPVAFRCSCSRERTAGMLRALGEAEVRDILAEQGKVEVGCEFCGRKYVFDAVDVEALLTGEIPSEGSRSSH